MAVKCQPSGLMSNLGVDNNDIRDNDRPRRDLSTLSWITVVVSLFSALFLFALDQTVVADIQPQIIASFGNVDKLPWVSVAYPLGAIALNLLVSSLFGLFDNKVLFIIGVLLFEVGSAVCASSPNMTALIIGRVVCGLGGVGIFVGTMNLLSFFTTEKERPIYLNIVGLTWGAGTILGPIVGGAFSNSSATWRWAFWINLCVGAVMAPVYLCLLPSYNPCPSVSVADRVRRLDWIGALLSAGAMTSLVMGISFGGGTYNWNSGQIIGLFATSGTLWVVFVVQQALAIGTTTENRVFPVEYVFSRQMNIFFAQTASAISITMIPLFFIPLYFQFTQNDTALKAGVRLLPFVCFEVLGTVASGVFLQEVGYYLPLYLLGGMLSLVGGILFYFVRAGTGTAAIYGYSVLVGLGTGLFVQTSYPVAQLQVPAAQIPRVVAFLGYGQIVGIALSLSISSSVFLNTATNKISEVLLDIPRNVVQQAVTGTGGSFLAELEEHDRGLVLKAISETIGNIYGMVIAAAGFSIILSMFTRWERISLQPKSDGKDEESNRGTRE